MRSGAALRRSDSHPIRTRVHRRGFPIGLVPNFRMGAVPARPKSAAQPSSGVQRSRWPPRTAAQRLRKSIMAFLTTMARVRRVRTRLHRRIAWLAALVLLGAVNPIAAAETAPSAAYQLKAVFLFNFAQFVEWPAGAFRAANSPLIIGVLGENPFGTY